MNGYARIRSNFRAQAIKMRILLDKRNFGPKLADESYSTKGLVETNSISNIGQVRL